METPSFLSVFASFWWHGLKRLDKHSEEMQLGSTARKLKMITSDGALAVWPAKGAFKRGYT